MRSASEGPPMSCASSSGFSCVRGWVGSAVSETALFSMDHLRSVLSPGSFIVVVFVKVWFVVYMCVFRRRCSIDAELKFERIYLRVVRQVLVCD